MDRNERKQLPEKIILKIGQPPLLPLRPYELFLRDQKAFLKQKYPNITKHSLENKAWKNWKFDLKHFEKEAYRIRVDEM